MLMGFVATVAGVLVGKKIYDIKKNMLNETDEEEYDTYSCEEEYKDNEECENEKIKFEDSNIKRHYTIMITEREFIAALAAQLYEQAPNRSPRNADFIIKQARDLFRADSCNSNEWYTLRISPTELYTYLEKILYKIPEFAELNITQKEYDNGLRNPYDENRPKYHFVSSYDTEIKDSWRYDFVDLDAFIRNFHNRLLKELDANEDCFGCENSCEGEPTDCINCSLCICNPNFTNNFNSRRVPKGDHKFCCSYDCYRCYYICCEECKYKDNCEHKCEGSSDTCGLAIKDVKPDEDY